MTKNLNWKVVTKKLVTFKRWNRAKGKSPICRGDLPKKREGLEQFADLRWG